MLNIFQQSWKISTLTVVICALFTSILLMLSGILPTEAALCSGDVCNIFDDATGGECTLIGTWDDPSNTCTMTGDLTGDTLSIDDNDITLNGGGNSLSGTATFGVLITGRTNVIVENINISGFTFGVNIGGSSSDVTVRNSNISNASAFAVRSFPADNTTVENVTSSGTGSMTALFLEGGSGIVARNNTISGPIRGIFYKDVTSGMISGNSITPANGSPEAIVFNNGDNITVFNNTIDLGGIFLEAILLLNGSSSNIISYNNIINGAQGAAIELDSGDGNILNNNQVLEAGQSGGVGGIEINSNGNSLKNNVALTSNAFRREINDTLAGSTGSGNVCDNIISPTLTCTYASTICGDLKVLGIEQCDDGNTTDGDGCSATCILETPANCGNSTIDAGEQCDDGNTTGADGCNEYCQLDDQPICGNGSLEVTEQCDDSNTNNGDGCSNICQLENATLQDNVSGGDCQLIGGTWTAGTKTCELGSDLNGVQIAISSNDITLDCGVSNKKLTGAGFGIGVSMTGVSDVSVKNCVIDGYSTGIQIGSGNSNITIEDNTIQNMTVRSINHEDSIGSVITGNTLQSSPDGIRINPSTVSSGNFTISNNSINVSTFEGIEILDVRGASNLINGNNSFLGTAGIRIADITADSSLLTINGNTFSADTGGDTLALSSMAASETLSVSNNTFNGDGATAINISSDNISNLSISGNDISNNYNRGILVFGNDLGTNNIIENNTLDLTNTDIGNTAMNYLSIGGLSSGPIIRNNIINGNNVYWAGMIVTRAEAALIQNNTVTNTLRTGIQLSFFRNSNIRFNTVSNNGQNGISLASADCSGNNFDYNTTDNNTSNGIFIASACTNAKIQRFQSFNNTSLDIRNDAASTSGFDNSCGNAAGSAGYTDTHALSECLFSSSICGDGRTSGDEQCDDGNTSAADGCSAVCELESPLLCGNSTVDPGESCDDGNSSFGDGCNEFCQFESICGNTLVELSEDCDDGNILAGDSCSAICSTEGGSSRRRASNNIQESISTGNTSEIEAPLTVPESIENQTTNVSKPESELQNTSEKINTGLNDDNEPQTLKSAALIKDPITPTQQEELLYMISIIKSLGELFSWISPDDYQLTTPHKTLAKQARFTLAKKQTHKRIGSMIEQRDALQSFNFSYKRPEQEPIMIIVDFMKSLMLSYGSICFSEEELMRAISHDTKSNDYWYAGYLYFMQPFFDQIIGTPYLLWRSIDDLDILNVSYRFLSEYCESEAL